MCCGKELYGLITLTNNIGVWHIRITLWRFSTNWRHAFAHLLVMHFLATMVCKSSLVFILVITLLRLCPRWPPFNLLFLPGFSIGCLCVQLSLLTIP